jgi:M6 family metalloprotease-like protein
MATPFIGKVFTFTQPDGTEIQVRGWGDQHYAVFETLDGYTVVKNPATGFFEIAQVSDDGTLLEPAPGPPGNLDGTRAGVAPGVRITREAARARGMEAGRRMGGRRCDRRREERKNLARALRSLRGPLSAPPRRGTVGDFVGLCLLVEFPDVAGTIPPTEVDRFCNRNGYTGYGNNGSVYDYYFDNSLGRCRYTNIVTDYYRARHPRSYYTDPAIPQGIRARQLIVEALTDLKARSFDFSRLSADDGGYVYALNVYYAGGVVNNWAEGLWPHAWCLASPLQLLPGKAAFDYQFTNMGGELCLGTFCHENGHMLCDYPDLYDYGSESSGIGAYCLMCSGANIDEKNPSQICAYLKRLSGWAGRLTSVGHDPEIALAADNNEFAIFARDGREYFLVENRVKSGRDTALPDEGLAIWHIDEDGSNDNEQRTPAEHYEVSLEQADGEFRLESTRYHYGDGTDLFGRANTRFGHTTFPDSKWWDGSASNLDISDISPPGAAMRFKARLSPDDEAPGAVHGESAPSMDIPDNRPEGITDRIVIDADEAIAAAAVTLDIRHTYRGDLRVTLLAPWGDAVVLQERHQGGGDDDIRVTLDASDLPALAAFQGHRTRGDWLLTIQDLAPVDTGRLERWALDFVTTRPAPTEIILEEAPGAHIPDDDPTGITRTLAAQAAGTVDSLEVTLDITHTYIGDLKIDLRSPAGTTATLHDRSGGSADNIDRTCTPATTPSLNDFAGQPAAGDWQLKVVDAAGRDVGKLNAWRVVIRCAA